MEEELIKGFSRGELLTISAKRVIEEEAGESYLKRAILLINELKDTVNDMSKPKTYYCENCFHIRGKLIRLEEGVLNDPTPHLACPKCLGEWKINQGQARHVIMLKLQHYQNLAEKLGMVTEPEKKTEA